MNYVIARDSGFGRQTMHVICRPDRSIVARLATSKEAWSIARLLAGRGGSVRYAPFFLLKVKESSK